VHARGPVLRDRGIERVSAHRELRVRGNAAQRVVSEAEQDDALVDGGVRVLGAVHTERPDIGAAGETRAAHVGHRELACRCQSVQRRDRGRVVDHTFESVWQSEQLA